MGDSPNERALAGLKEQLSTVSSRIVFTAVQCPELDSLRRGDRDDIQHWILVQVVASVRGFTPLSIKREPFLDSVAKTKLTLTTDALNKQIVAALGDQETQFSDASVSIAGRDKNAVFMVLHGSMTTEAGAQALRGVGALTLLRSWPLSVGVYETAGDAVSRDQLRPILTKAVASLVAENE